MAEITKKMKRDGNATKARILKAAKQEFARHGLGGSRVDEIAKVAQVNKRMIYHFFFSKEKLFQTVLERAYLDIRKAETELDLQSLSAPEALEKLVRFTWNYYLKNPEFLSLVNSENLHRAKHIKSLSSPQIAYRGLVKIVEDVLRRGQESGEFSTGIDATQLNITIAAISYFYLTNRYTGSQLYERDLMSREALEERIAFNVETILRLVRK